MTEKSIYFDMDGTIADLYSVPDWLYYLRHENPKPYKVAEPCLNLSTLARLLNKLKKCGYKIGIISWGSMDSSENYLSATARAKRQWLKKHLPSVQWDEIHITKYGVPKQTIGKGILFDDNKTVRIEWGENAYTENEIIDTLKALLKEVHI